MVRTQRLFQENVARWNRAKDEEAKRMLLEHAKQSKLPINQEVNDGQYI
jgi:hypothetical protein